MTTFSMFAFAVLMPVAFGGTECAKDFVAANNKFQTISASTATPGCYCGNDAPTPATDNCGDTAGGNMCLNKRDGSKACSSASLCSNTAGTAKGSLCECIATLSATAVDLCSKDGYCYATDTAGASKGPAAYTCANQREGILVTLPVKNVAITYVPAGLAKCGDNICAAGEYCSATNTCSTPTIPGTGGDTDKEVAAADDGSTNMGNTAANTWCTILAASGTALKWDVMSAVKTNTCIAPLNNSPGTTTEVKTAATTNIVYQVHGAPVVSTAAFAVATPSDCTPFKVIGYNSICYAAGTKTGTALDRTDVTMFCSGGSFYYPVAGTRSGAQNRNSTSTLISTMCKVAGPLTSTSAVAPTLCKAHASNINNACACAPIAASQVEVHGDERGCPVNGYCYAQAIQDGMTFQGVNTCSQNLATDCFKLATGADANTDLSLTGAANNGTLFTMAHSATTGYGEACFCGSVICGAGRACISSNATGWTGVANDGANGASGATKSDQCLSAAIDHCTNSTGATAVAAPAARATPWKIDSEAANLACYCDSGETTICGAGRYCLNNTASGFTGSAECLSSSLVHCSNYTGFTSANEACTCSSSLTCGQGTFCINSTHFTDTTSAAECLSAQIAPCVNWTKALGANTNACTCGKDVCAGGQHCDSNTTCTSGSTPAPTGGDGSSASYEKPAIAFLTVVAIVFSALY